MVVSSVNAMLQDEGGVSAVIGVILMIAVTVVLAGVIGAFVFGVGENLNQPVPQTQVNFVYDEADNQVTIYHDGGEILQDSNTGSLRITGDVTSSDGTWGSKVSGGTVDSQAVEIGDEIWDSGTGTISSGDEVSLEWVSNDGTESANLGTFQAP